MRKLRGRYIADLMNELDAEGIIIDVDDQAMLGAYLRGEICDRDLLAHVCQFQDLTSYQRWLQQGLAPNAKIRRSTPSVEQLVREVSAHFLRKYAVGDPECWRHFRSFQDVAGLLDMFRLSAVAEVDSNSVQCPVGFCSISERGSLLK